MSIRNKKVTGLPFRIDPSAAEDIEYLVERVSNKTIRRDAVILYDGEEGSGKTTISTQHFAYFALLSDISFGLKNFYFTPSQIYESVQVARRPAGTPFLYDEGVTGLLAKTAMSKMHIKLQIMFSTCRSKRYPIFVCIPRFRELPDWLAIDRSIGLYRTYTRPVGNEPDQPGFYKGYDKSNKKKLWLLEKSKRFDLLRRQVVSTQEMEFSGWPFSVRSEQTPFTYEKYERYKRQSLRQEDSATTKTQDGWLRHRNAVWKYLSEVDGLSQRKIAEISGISYSVVAESLRK